MTSPVAQKIRTPTASWVLNYAGNAWQGDLQGTVIEVKFTNNSGSQTSELEIQIEDQFQQWQGVRFPALGDNIWLEIGYEPPDQLPCGFFEIDEVELNGPPDVIHLHARWAPLSVALRTRNTVSWEKQTLLGIAQIIAYKHGFKLIASKDLGAINVEFVRQYRETDLGFLRRLAIDYSYDFTVANVPAKPDPTKPSPPTSLVFFSLAASDATNSVATIDRADGTVLSFNFHARTHLIYAGARVSYFDPNTKTLLTYLAMDPNAPSALKDILQIHDRCENLAQAKIKAESALKGANFLFSEGDLTVIGTTKYVPGNNLEVTGFGKYDGKYRINTAEHVLSRGKGYTTKLDLMKILVLPLTGAP